MTSDRKTEPSVEYPRGRGETILVVEGDSDVRTLLVNMLRDLGYEILEVSNGISALAVMSVTPNIDLILTDVVLPISMNSTELAQATKDYHPSIKALLTSGYNHDALLQQHPMLNNAEMIYKPFEMSEFAKKLRSMIDGSYQC